jgi:polar amino acid transport system substrate-binding protein
MAIKDYADLAGKRIGVTRATPTTPDHAERQGPRSCYEDDATLITSMVTGQVDLFSSTPSNLGNAEEGAARTWK